MASPAVASTATSDDTNKIGNVLSTNMPSGVVSGDLLIVIVAADRADSTPINWPAGWIELYDTVSGTNVTGAMAYKVSDGTEGSSIDITLTNIQSTCARSYRITGHDSTVEAEFIALATSTTQTPPQITPSYGSRDYLFITVDHIDTYIYTINSFPSGYGNTSDLKSGPSGARCGLGTSDKSELAVTTETPGNYVLSNTKVTLAGTIAIPAPSSGGVTVTGTTPSFNYSSIAANIDLTGSIDVTGQTANYTYSTINGVTDLTGDILITGATASYNYQSINGVVDLTGEITVLGATPNQSYSSVSGIIELGAVISVVGLTPNYNYQGIAGEVSLNGEILVSGETPSYSYSAIKGFITTGEAQVIGTVTSSFASDVYSSGFKPSTITVNFKS